MKEQPLFKRPHCHFTAMVILTVELVTCHERPVLSGNLCFSEGVAHFFITWCFLTLKTSLTVLKIKSRIEKPIHCDVLFIKRHSIIKH